MCLKFADVFHDGGLSLWKCVYIYFISMYWHLVNAQPELCDSSDANKTIVATLGTSINFSVCVVANISSPPFPILKVNHVWLTRDQEGSNKMTFTWENTNISTPDVFMLRIFIRNITVYHYGKFVIRLLTSEHSGLDLIVNIIPSEEDTIKLNFTDSEELLCEVNWSLKTAQIRNELTGQVINTLDNRNKMEMQKNIKGHLSNVIKECDNTGIYTCAVTDFQNIIHELQLINRKSGCPVKFCDEKNRTIYNVTSNRTVNFSLCLFYNDNVDIEAVNIPNLSSEWRKDMVNESYLLLHLSIVNISVSSAGDYNIEIIAVNKRMHKVEKLNRILTLFFHNAIKLCHTSSNNTKVMASVGQNVNIEICIEDSYKNLQNVSINQSPVDWENMSVQKGRIFVLKKNSTDKYYLEVTILDITEHSPLEYKVMLSTVLKDVLLYKFQLILEDSLSLCEKEKSFTSIKTQRYGSVTVHICYTTNFVAIDYCGIDNELYKINDSEDQKDVYVSVEQFNINSKYFMQIYFRNVTQEKISTILLKTTHSQILNYTVEVSFFKEKDYELTSYDGHEIKTYYYSQLYRNLSLCVVRLSTKEKLKISVQQHGFIHHGLANTSSEQITNVYISVNDSFVFVDIINVTEYNFGRYDVNLKYNNRSIYYTFYLVLDTLALPSSICNGGNKEFSLEASRVSLLSICFRTFGNMDRTIFINNYSVPIVSSFKDTQKYQMMSDWELHFKNVSVFTKWNQQLKTRYIQINLMPSHNQEMKIEFVSSNRILVYNISLIGTENNANVISENNSTNDTRREFTNRTGSLGSAPRYDMESSVYVYAVPTIVVVVCTVVLIIVFIVRKKAKAKPKKVETQPNTYTQGQRSDSDYVNVDNQNDVMYMNLKMSRPRSLRLVPNAPDLTKDLDERIYLNTCELEQESSFNGLGDGVDRDLPSGRYISDEGLLYVTLSHANSLRSANSSASSRQTDNVVYASLDLEKSGKIPLLQFKRSRHKQKKKISDKKSMIEEDLH